jgi:hypothetical protein
MAAVPVSSVDDPEVVVPTGTPEFTTDVVPVCEPVPLPMPLEDESQETIKNAAKNAAVHTSCPQFLEAAIKGNRIRKQTSVII